jgi:hypothetical protein
MTALLAVAAWLQPVLLAALALGVAAGDAEAPWLVVGALIAPLIALLAPGGRPVGANPVAAVAGALAVVLVLAADFIVLGDAAALLGAAPWHGIAPAVALALLAPRLPAARILVTPALALATTALVLSLAAVGVTNGVAPWTAWSEGARRPALTFPSASAWVVQGERFARPASLTFTEGQRVTVMTPGLYRVVERDAVPPTVREWRLAAGETLALRPGDELSVEAGVRLRFEAGHRMPGAPASGVAWADAPARGPAMLLSALGALATLVGGALALMPTVRRPGAFATVGPLALLACVGVAVGWGLYTAALAPDLALGGSALAPLVHLPTRALDPRTGGAIAALALGAVGVLLTAGAIGLSSRLAASAGPRAGLWLGVTALAAALTPWELDPWSLLVLGLGLAAAAWAPSRLASSRTGALVGSSVGALVFVALAALPLLAPTAAVGLGALTRYPALVALPLGWAAARASATPSRHRRGRSRR